MNVIRDLCLVIILFGLVGACFVANQKLDALAQDVKATQGILFLHVDKVESQKPYTINEAIKDIFSQEK